MPYTDNLHTQQVKATALNITLLKTADSDDEGKLDDQLN